MLSEPTYLAARMVAPALEAHFAQHRAADEHLGGARALPLPPPAALIEAIIDVAFWASLRREEGRPPRISLALLAPEAAEQPLLLGHRLRLTPPTLIKLAPAVEQPGIHLGVGHDDHGLYVWGTFTHIPPVCFVLEVVEPGLLVAKHRRADGFGKFVNVAVRRGDQIRVVDEENQGLAGCPALRESLPGIARVAARHCAFHGGARAGRGRGCAAGAGPRRARPRPQGAGATARRRGVAKFHRAAAQLPGGAGVPGPLPCSPSPTTSAATGRLTY